MQILKDLIGSPKFSPQEKLVMLLFALDASPKSIVHLRQQCQLHTTEVEFAFARALKRDGYLAKTPEGFYVRGENPVWAAIDAAVAPQAPQAAADLELKPAKNSKK